MNRISNARVNIHNLFPPDKLPNYVKQKLEEKQRIDEEIRQADAILQKQECKGKNDK